MKGFLTIDGVIAVSILILTFISMINQIHIVFDVNDIYGHYSQILGAVTSAGTASNALYALDPASGNKSEVALSQALPAYIVKISNETTGSGYHWSSIDFQCYSTNSGLCKLRTFYYGTEFSYPTFIKSVSGRDITLDSQSGGYVRSLDRPEDISFTSCEDVLEVIKSAGFSYGKANLYWDVAPWYCDTSCYGLFSCMYSCSPSLQGDCSDYCANVGIYPPSGSTSGNVKSLSCKLMGPYYNESNILNDTCGGFPPDPSCTDAPADKLYEVFWVTYNFTLSSIPGSELYVNAIARNGVVIYVNGKTVSCTASAQYSEIHARIRKYLKVGQNTITIMFLRTDSVCGPCVYHRPAYGVSGSWLISCDSSGLDTGYFGWMGCEDELTLYCVM